LHIGHAKAICLNFGIAEQYPGGLCNLRFDDTNPTKEDTSYVESIQRDVRWLGFDWQTRLFYASDYFERLFEFALELIENDKAFVCDLSPDEIRATRGTLIEPGRNSPYRDRSVSENLDLFRRMRAGEFAEGARVLRAKIDMASANLNLRDPVVYRILKASHHRTGDDWCIYPTYDFAHGLSDALEGITHSLCTLEFENHRPLYDWFIDNLDVPARPRQIEFAPLVLTYALTSKRKLLQLVQGGQVSGWDDPRMPTLSGLRRRGYTPSAIRQFCEEIGITKANTVIDMVRLENCLREEQNRTARRVMAVLRPLRLVIENYPEGRSEELEAVNNPEDPSAGTRKVLFSRELYVEREDYREDPPKQYYRLAPGQEVRLRYAYYVTCREAVKDERGEIVELRCTYDPKTRGGDSPDGRKVRGTIHWVSAPHALRAEVRLYDHLFAKPDPGDVPEGGDFRDNLNPGSLETLEGAQLERDLENAVPGRSYQFERQGYFVLDEKDSRPGRPVFNRSVTLRDSWTKIEKNLSARG
jgi:glutaminyl-tRNA synthetase